MAVPLVSKWQHLHYDYGAGNRCTSFRVTTGLSFLHAHNWCGLIMRVGNHISSRRCL
ncbi:hypothetical protein Y023_5674 [Burkholderia pseudomallei A79D]|nr:hypothetical protein Y023_5674 [Burkholderia pseudomallei A79D]KGX95431.1 hypothetical protein X997_5516 [Burkholderia pseudomallei A79C]